MGATPTPGATRLLVVGLVVVAAGCEVFVPPPPGEFLVRAIEWPGCPTDTEPLPPDCRPINVADAPIVITLADGSDAVVARGRTDHDGRVFLEVPPGTYLVGGGEVEGLTTPEPLRLEVNPGGTTETTLQYTSGPRIDDDGHP